jgi:hypothetical protein
MHTSRLLVSVLVFLVVAAVAAWWLGATEVLRVRAIEVVPLFDPSTLAGKIGDAPKQVGELDVGEELPVISCEDRKSDINLHATYQGKVVAVGEWKAKVKLLRRKAFPWEQNATSSCRGFFGSISAHA